MCVWKGSHCVHEWVIGDDVHGTVFSDAWFGGGSGWDETEEMVAYVAEVDAALTVGA